MKCSSGVVILVLLLATTGHTLGYLLDSAPKGNASECRDVVQECAILNSTVDICNDFDKAKRICPLFCNICPTDGAWTSWTDWSGCSVTCSEGKMIRSRTCSNPTPANGGNMCSGSNQESKNCTLETCPVHGGWSTWSAFGECSQTCGTGLQRKDRYCNNPYPTKDGDYCYGEGINYQVCEMSTCSDWTPWSPWGSCSNTCGSGIRSRTRACTGAAAGPNICEGDTQEYTDCKTTCLQYFHNTSSAFSANYIDIYKADQGRFTNVLLNEGNDYNSVTGTFTCRIPGLYFFSSTLTKKRSFRTVTGVFCSFYLNYTWKMDMLIDPTDDDTDIGSYSVSASLAFYLKLHDTVYLSSCAYATNFDTKRSSFSGFLIKADVS